MSLKKFLEGVELNELVDDGTFLYELILPTSISEFNRSLNRKEKKSSERPHIEDGFDMYFPPCPIIDILTEDALNAGVLRMDEKKGYVSLKCDNLGHAEGFLRYYIRNMIE